MDEKEIISRYVNTWFFVDYSRRNFQTKDLAKGLHVVFRTIYNIRNGDVPVSLEILKKYADYIEVPISDVLEAASKVMEAAELIQSYDTFREITEQYHLIPGKNNDVCDIPEDVKKQLSHIYKLSENLLDKGKINDMSVKDK